MSDTKFYKTVYTVEVLTINSELTDLGLREMARQCVDGECSGDITAVITTELTRDEMSKALVSQGSDPNFLLGADLF